MDDTKTLVSVGLPVRNGAERIEHVVRSVLDQDHENLELVICDNASTDDTEELCRELANQDSRIVYHRNPVNIGLLNNFIRVMQLSSGTFFRWVGDDDWLAPNCVAEPRRLRGRRPPDSGDQRGGVDRTRRPSAERCLRRHGARIETTRLRASAKCSVCSTRAIC